MLASTLLRGDGRLQACATQASRHLCRGERGSHVSRIHMAMTLLGCGPIEAGEWQAGCYGASTAATVLAYKRARNIVNRTYQQQADNIVGVMTVQRLDTELLGLEARLPRAIRVPTHGPVRDSAWAFEARRCIELLRSQAGQPAGFDFRAGSAPGGFGSFKIDIWTAAQLINLLGDKAGSFDQLVQLLRQFPAFSEADAVGPVPGGDRAKICAQAETRNADLGYKFEEGNVASCWTIVKPGNLPKPEKIGVQWCGIYAAKVWQDSGHSAVTWHSAGQQGIHGASGLVTSSSNLMMLAPGDILVDQRPLRDKEGNDVYPRHHVLVLGITGDRRYAEILQGNSGKGTTASTRIVTRVARYKLPTPEVTRGPYTFYSVDTLRDKSVVYR